MKNMTKRIWRKKLGKRVEKKLRAINYIFGEEKR